jgi:hypothetical protein
VGAHDHELVGQLGAVQLGDEVPDWPQAPGQHLGAHVQAGARERGGDVGGGGGQGLRVVLVAGTDLVGEPPDVAPQAQGELALGLGQLTGRTRMAVAGARDDGEHEDRAEDHGSEQKEPEPDPLIARSGQKSQPPRHEATSE